MKKTPVSQIESSQKSIQKVVKKTAIKKVLTDSDIDIEAFDLEFNAHIPLPKIKTQTNLKALPICPQGKQPKVIRDNCRVSRPVNTSQYITALHVKLSTQTLTVTWLDGKKETWLCSPNPKLTPKGKDLVGVKCGAKHTNYKRDGMAWFTSFKSRGMAYGFHNSQRVGLGVVSHGCVRVSCEHAKLINENTWSGKTTIQIVS